jgi:hypothetical protein
MKVIKGSDLLGLGKSMQILQDFADPVKQAERKVIDAAVTYTEAASALGEHMKRGGDYAGAFDDSIAKQAALFHAVDNLVAARASAIEE